MYFFKKLQSFGARLSPRRKLVLAVIVLVFIATGFMFTMGFYKNVDKIPSIKMINEFLANDGGAQNHSSVFLNVDLSSDYMNVCALPVYDVFHPTIKKFVKPYTSADDCDNNITMITELKNGEWRVLQEGANCSARCIEGIGAKNFKKGNWSKPGRVKCEFLEAVCWKGEKEVYGYMHSQVIRKNITNQTTFENPPNVFVFLTDSMSYGGAKRSLPKTLQFLSATLKAVEFPFINKVGENSQPNAFALWFGKQVKKGITIGGEDMHVDWNDTEHCERYLDDEAHIFKDFASYGYVTMQAEDWAEHVIDSFPSCNGFKNPQVHHPMRPFQLALAQSTSKTFRKRLVEQRCRWDDHAIIEYFQQWAAVYKDRPKFSWIWLTIPGHDSFNGIAKYDDFYLEFFQKNEELFSNSFLFFMGDHGYRLGYDDLYETEIGTMEKNNPYLAISVPHEIRTKNPEILDILRKNAESLQTHYDTRATFLDVLKYQPLSAFSDRKRINTPTEKGNSYLREQPEFPRTCGTLPIPQQFCICQVKTMNVNDPLLQVEHGKRLVNHINKLIENEHLSDICMKYKFKKVTEMLSLGFSNYRSKKYHRYKISVQVFGSDAHFDTLIMHDEKMDTMEYEQVIRLDTYGRSADCTADRGFQKLCYCKVQQLLTTTTTTAPK